MNIRTRWLAPMYAVLLVLPVVADDKPPTAGPTAEGFLLPNGWSLTPAGRHVALTDLPLNIIPLAGSGSALVATSGYNKHELTVVNLEDSP